MDFLINFQVVFVTSSGEVGEMPHEVSGGGGGSGAGVVGGDFFVQESVGDLNGGEVIQMQEEEIIETPSSETEMSVAMEMAKLSQGGEHHGGGGEGTTIYTSPNGTQYQEEVYGNVSDSENMTPSPSNVILPPSAAANVGGGGSGKKRRSSNASGSAASTPSGPPPALGSDGTEKPRMSYAQLIAEALMSSDDRMLPLAEIYHAINRRYPYYRMDVKSWQNAIRHNLTLNPAFTKIPRPNNEGRGNYWRMEEGSEKTIFRRQIRAAQNRTLMEEKARAAAILKQQRQNSRQQQVLQRRSLLEPLPSSTVTLTGSGGGSGGGGQTMTYQLVTQGPNGQTVVAPAGPTRYICVRPSGLQAAGLRNSTGSLNLGSTTVVNRPTIQLVSPTRSLAGTGGTQTIQIVSAGSSPNIIKMPVASSSVATRPSPTKPTIVTLPGTVPAKPTVVTTPKVVNSSNGGAGPRIMKIKDTIVRQNGSVVFIAMPSNASAIAPNAKVTPSAAKVVTKEEFEKQQEQEEEEEAVEQEQQVVEEEVIQEVVEEEVLEEAEVETNGGEEVVMQEEVVPPEAVVAEG